MTYEEMQKIMQFIVEQQAQFASAIIQIKEFQAQFTSDINQIKESQAQTARRHDAALQELNEAETALMRALTTVVGIAGDHNARITRLETAVAEVAERVSAFIAALRNGKSKKG